MPNWCNTRIKFLSRDDIPESVAMLDDLRNKIAAQIDSGKSLADNGFGPGWLGNMCLLFNIETIENIYDTKVAHCRGIIYDISDTETLDDGRRAFQIYQEDVWAPMVYMWKCIIDKNYVDANGEPYITILYAAEEEGNELYETNDSDGDIMNVGYHIDMRLPLTTESGSVPDFSYIDKETNKIDKDLVNGVSMQTSIDFDVDEDILCVYSDVNFSSLNDLLIFINMVIVPEGHQPMESISEAREYIDKYISEICPEAYGDGGVYCYVHEYKYHEIDYDM